MKPREKRQLSTIADEACPLAERFGLGLGIVDFCTASKMDRDCCKSTPRKRTSFARRAFLRAEQRGV